MKKRLMNIPLPWLFCVIGGLSLLLIYSLLQLSKSSEEVLCEDVAEKRGTAGCDEVIFADFQSGLVFFEYDQRVLGTDINRKKDESDRYSIGGIPFSQIFESGEEIWWSASDEIVYGYATVNVSKIHLVNEHNLQPTKVRTKQGWLWYYVGNGEKINFPILINAYDDQGNLVYGKGEKW